MILIKTKFKQLNQYQQTQKKTDNYLSPKSSNTKRPRTRYDDGNSCPSVEQAYKCGGL